MVRFVPVQGAQPEAAVAPRFVPVEQPTQLDISPTGGEPLAVPPIQASTDVQFAPPALQAPLEDPIVARGEFLPIGRTASGEVELALPGSVERARQTVMDLLSGQRQASDISGQEVFEIGGLLSGTGAAARAAAPVVGRAAEVAGPAAARVAEAAGPAAARAAQRTQEVATQGGQAASQLVRRKIQEFFPQLPETETLRTRARAAYQRAEDAGVTVSPERFGQLSGDIVAAVNRAGFDPLIQRQSGVMLKRIQDRLEQPMSLQEIDNLRQLAGGIVRGNDPNDARIARIVVERIDNMLDNIKPSDVMRGQNARLATASLRDARRFWRAFRKAELIDDLFDRAQTSAPNFSGSGMENALRTEFRALAKNPKRLKMFTPAEQRAVKRVARGGPVENLMRQLGKFAPTGVVSTALSGGIGAGLGGAAGAVLVPMAGLAARQTATALTRRNVNRLNQLVRDVQPGPPVAATPSGPAAAIAGEAARRAGRPTDEADQFMQGMLGVPPQFRP